MHEANGGKLSALFFVLYLLGPILLPFLMAGHCPSCYTVGWQITNNYLCWRFQSFGMWCSVTGLYYSKFLWLLHSKDEGSTVLWDIKICSPSNAASQKKWILAVSLHVSCTYWAAAWEGGWIIIDSMCMLHISILVLNGVHMFICCFSFCASLVLLVDILESTKR